MINQKHKDRAFKFGASDTHFIMSNWNTATFLNWWQSKIGVLDTSFKNIYTIIGTYKEHQIADWYSNKYGMEIVKDRKIKVRNSKLVVNLDCETKYANIEIKTYKMTDKEWKLPTSYWQQCQVQTFASGKMTKLIAYGLIEEDYNNFYLPIKEERIKQFEIKYDEQWVLSKYLPREKYLEYCLKSKKTPKESEFEIWCLKQKEFDYIWKIRR